MDIILQVLHNAISFFVIISVIVFVHEFGHFIIARWCGVKVDAFSIGFGKELWGFTDRRGTRWKISPIPIGGYVKMFGDSSEASTADTDALEAMSEEEKGQTFHFKPLWKKAAIVAAGPIFNFVLTICVFTYFIFTVGVESTQPIAGEIMADSAAQEAGMLAGDRIISINDQEVDSFRDIPLMIATNLGTPVHIVLDRTGKRVEVTLTPKSVESEDAFGNKVQRPLIGIKSQRLTYESVGLARALAEAVRQTYLICTTTLHVTGQILTGQRTAAELKGPIGIASLSGQAAEKDFHTILWFIAMLSANLGLVNLFPVPLLDGGHLLYYSIEAVRGKPMARRFQEFGFRIGLALILMLMGFTIFNDVRNLF